MIALISSSMLSIKAPTMTIAGGSVQATRISTGVAK
jgi:hypothetical protein